MTPDEQRVLQVLQPYNRRVHYSSEIVKETGLPRRDVEEALRSLHLQEKIWVDKWPEADPDYEESSLFSPKRVFSKPQEEPLARIPLLGEVALDGQRRLVSG